MSFRYGVLPAAAIATALVLAATGAAFAQAAGGRGGGGSSGPGAEPDPTKVLTYGLPGNCPPTVAGCGEIQKPKPTIAKKKYDPCGDFAIGTAAYRECKRKQ
jgi:hypothetical protein